MKWSILKLNDKESCRPINPDEIVADIVVDHAAILIGEGAPHVQDSVLLNVTQLPMSFEAIVDVQLVFVSVHIVRLCMLVAIQVKVAQVAIRSCAVMSVTCLEKFDVHRLFFLFHPCGIHMHDSSSHKQSALLPTHVVTCLFWMCPNGGHRGRSRHVGHAGRERRSGAGVHAWVAWRMFLFLSDVRM